MAHFRHELKPTGEGYRNRECPHQWVMLDVWDVARKLSITEEDAVNAIQDSIVWIGEEMLPEDLAVEYYINRK